MNVFHRIATTLVVCATACVTSQAGEIVVASSSGGPPTFGTSTTPKKDDVEINLNPSSRCTTWAGRTLASFLEECVGALNAEGFTAVKSEDEFGGKITLDSLTRPVDRVHVREGDADIQSVRLTLEADGLTARIGRFKEDASSPARGQLFVTLNDRTFSFATAGLDREQLSDLLMRYIEAAGFSLGRDQDTIMVRWDLVNQTAIWRVGIRSTDPEVITSDLELLPGGRPPLIIFP